MGVISVIIVSWNTRDLLATCLRSLERHHGSEELEIIVVDNASSDGSQAMVREHFPHVHLIANGKNVGFARANNQGLQVSTGEMAVLLNSDAEILADTLVELAACFARHADTGIVGGVLLNPDGSFQASYNSFPTVWSEFLLLTGLSRRVYGPHFPSAEPEASTVEHQVDWVGGACMAVRRQALIQVGGLDERYFLYSEEMDWCYAMRRGGWKVYFCPTARTIHHGGQSSNQANQRRLSRLYRSKVQFFGFHYGPGAAFSLRVLVAVTSAVKIVLVMARSLIRRRQPVHVLEDARMYWNALWLADKER